MADYSSSRSGDSSSESEDENIALQCAMFGTLLAEHAIEKRKKKKKRKKPRFWVRDAFKERDETGHYARLLPQLRKDREFCHRWESLHCKGILASPMIETIPASTAYFSVSP